MGSEVPVGAVGGLGFTTVLCQDHDHYPQLRQEINRGSVFCQGVERVAGLSTRRGRNSCPAGDAALETGSDQRPGDCPGTAARFGRSDRPTDGKPIPRMDWGMPLTQTDGQSQAPVTEASRTWPTPRPVRLPWSGGTVPRSRDNLPTERVAPWSPRSGRGPAGRWQNREYC